MTQATGSKNQAEKMAGEANLLASQVDDAKSQATTIVGEMATMLNTAKTLHEDIMNSKTKASSAAEATMEMATLANSESAETEAARRQVAGTMSAVTKIADAASQNALFAGKAEIETK